MSKKKSIYLAYNISIETSLFLIGFTKVKNRTDVFYSLVVDDTLKILHHLNTFPFGNPYCEIKADSAIISWRKSITYKIDFVNKIISVYKEDDLPEVDYSLSLNYILSIICYQNGMLPIHGACLKNKNNKKILIIGHSSIGKSTLTAKLLDNNWGFISEEMTALDIISSKIIPFGGAVYVRLKNLDFIKTSKEIDNDFELLASDVEKHCIWKANWMCSNDNNEINAIVFLVNSKTMSFEKLNFTEALHLLTQNIYAPTAVNKSLAIHFLKPITKICSKINCYLYSFEKYPSSSFLNNYVF